MTEQGSKFVSQDHYAYVTRSVIGLFNRGVLSNVVALDVEPVYGYTARLTYDDGTHRITYGNDLGLNAGAACDLAKDKGHTKFMLRQIGINCPEGQEFLLPWWEAAIAPSQLARGNTNMQNVTAALPYIDKKLGYPVYIKPVSGSKGLGVARAESAEETQDIFNSYEEAKVRVAIVEEAVDMPDYRVVVLDGELISAYQRKPLGVVGNGRSTIEELLEQLQLQYHAEGRDTIIDLDDPRIARQLGKLGYNLAVIPKKNEELTLTSVSNLSAGGTSVDVTEKIHKEWVDKVTYIAKNFNLRLCGVDLACSDIASDSSEYSVIEVNAAPGLDHYASSGAAQKKIVDELYAKVLNAYPHASHTK